MGRVDGITGGRQLRESRVDFDRRIQETERLLKENGAETDKEIKALAKNIGGRVPDSVGRYAQKRGLYVVEQSGGIGGYSGGAR
jgi:hypothetical protein